MDNMEDKIVETLEMTEDEYNLLRVMIGSSTYLDYLDKYTKHTREFDAVSTTKYIKFCKKLFKSTW
jgi:hypothetical protein